MSIAPLILRSFAFALGSAAAFASEPVDYLRDVKPLLDAKCVTCHGALKQKGKLRLDAGIFALKGAADEPVVKAGDPGASELIARVTSDDPDERMPRDAAPLPAQNVELLRRWIAEGANIPEHEVIPADPAAHWFFQPPKKIEPPITPGFEAFTNPIDRFVASEWKARGLSPQAPADKGILLRRVYLDLIGLPPTPAEAAAFDAASSPGAYEQIVDMLLADTRHGPRWARHFMDIWRYCDEMLDPCDNKTPMIGEYHLWHWRDWIVDSINSNKPYDRMVQEMLAGDELDPENEDAARATGYLVRNYTSLGGRDAWLADLVEHTSQAFLGVTTKCCRCHDHKYDPLPQTDYYRLRAIFEPVGKRLDYVAGATDPRIQGIPRAFDENPAARTLLFRAGNPRDPDDRKNIAPGVPAMLRAGELEIREATVPPEVRNPGARRFVREDRLKSVQAALEAAQAACTKLPAPQPDDSAVAKAGREAASAKTVAAEAELAAVRACIAADDARVASSSDKEKVASAAIETQRLLQRREAEAVVASAALLYETAVAARKGDEGKADADAKLKTLEEARAKLAKIVEEQAKPPEDYKSLWPVYPEHTSGRRLALARWIADRRNPATARVLVNHVWMRHFGQPLVDTVYDFGLHGHKPTHPELLDWLAVDFMESGWDLKHLHRLIVTSALYRLGSARLPGSDDEKIDPDNRYLWRMNSQRMQAEQVRDSVLYLSGKLDLAMGGPSIDPAKSDRDLRRSIYFRHTLDRGDKFMQMFDAADPNECYRRVESIVPQQALVMANSRLTFEQARLIARNIGADAAEPAFLDASFRLLLCRPPTTEEAALCAKYLDECRAAASSKEPPLTIESDPLVPPSADPVQHARECLVQVLFNDTDFVTIH